MYRQSSQINLYAIHVFNSLIKLRCFRSSNKLRYSKEECLYKKLLPPAPWKEDFNNTSKTFSNIRNLEALAKVFSRSILYLAAERLM